MIPLPIIAGICLDSSSSPVHINLSDKMGYCPEKKHNGKTAAQWLKMLFTITATFEAVATGKKSCNSSYHQEQWSSGRMTYLQLEGRKNKLTAIPETYSWFEC